MSTASAHCWRGRVSRGAWALGGMAHSRTSANDFGRCGGAGECCVPDSSGSRPHRHLLAAGGSLEVLDYRQALGEIERLAVQIAQAVLCRGGAGKEITLCVGAAELAQLLELLPALDPFGNHLDVQMARHGDDGAHDREVAEVGHQVAHEAAIDLERVHPPALEVREARVAGAEVVDGNVHTELAQLRHRILTRLARARLAPP